MKRTRTLVVTLSAIGLLTGALVLPNAGYAGEVSTQSLPSDPVEQVITEGATSIQSLEQSVSQASGSSTQPSVESSPEAEPQEPVRYDVTYIDEHCDEQLARQLLAVDNTTTELNAGWYVVREDVELTSPLVIEGDVRLILQKDCTLTAKEGIHVKKDATLTLYGQRDALGELFVRKGIVRTLTPEQQEEEDARIALELERDPNYKEEKPQMLFVEPCLEVVAGTHEPWPADAAEPDPDPDNAPKLIEKPVLDEALLGKDYLVVHPLWEHAMEERAEEDDHFTCKNCDEWFDDEEGHVAKEKPAPAVESEELVTSVHAEATVTITFDANGGSGSMDPLQVTAGENFVLPECDFTAPEGMVFNSWSLGKPGSSVSVPTDTTIRAWWVSASGTSNNGGDTSSGGSSSTSGSSNGQTAGQSNTSGSTTNANGSNNGSSPSTGDSVARLGEYASVLMVVGCVCILGSKLQHRA